MRDNALALQVAVYELTATDGPEDQVVLDAIDTIVKQLVKDAKQVRRYVEG